MKNNYLKNIISEAIDEILASKLPSKEDFDTDKFPSLYRIAFKTQLPNIFKYGYDREFTGSKGGNMYGPGVYCTFDLKSTIINFKRSMDQIKQYGQSEYGDCIVKMKLIGGFDHFLIFDGEIAKNTYGNRYKLKDQLEYLMPKETADKYYLLIKSHKPNADIASMYGRTAEIAYYVWTVLRDILYKKYKVRGIIYNGNRDGRCVLPYDFSSVVPYSVSFDGGHTFKKRFGDELYNRIRDNADVVFEYGDKYDKILKPTNGYAIAFKNNKCNLVEIATGNEISPVWFDSATTVDKNYEFKLVYNGIEFWACVDGVLNNRGNPWFKFEYLPQMSEKIKEQRKNRELMKFKPNEKTEEQGENNEPTM